MFELNSETLYTLLVQGVCGNRRSQTKPFFLCLSYSQALAGSKQYLQSEGIFVLVYYQVCEEIFIHFWQL